MKNARLLLLLSVFLFSENINPLLACGYNYVSLCATQLEIESNNNILPFYVGSCTWLTNFNGHNFGAVTELRLHKGSSTTWESCDNRVLNAKVFYRIYANGSMPGTFNELNLSNLTLGGTGAYRNRTYDALPDLDLLAGLPGGNYNLEVYFFSDVDFNNDNVPDGNLTMNNGGTFYKATFSKAGGSGGLAVTFPTKNNVSCPGGSNGKLTAAVTGGTAPYSFAWSNGATTATIQNLAAGSYTVTVTATGGLTGTASTSISQPAPLNISIAATDETSANANNGTATASTTGGTPNFSYAWSTGATTPNINGLDAGTYTVTATDANGCTASKNAVISTAGTIPGGYCAASGSFPWNEWLGQVTLGSLDNTSDKSSYSNFTNLAAPQLTAGEDYPITLKTGTGWFGVPEFWRVWIDFNRNGTFEANEQVLDATSNPPNTGSSQLTVNQTISIPLTAEEGITRMRVAIKRTAAPAACEALPFGEVEDYHVNILPASGSCHLTASVANLLCNDHSTPTDPSDDTYTFSLTVTAVGGGTGWTANINGTTQTGTYSTAKNLGPYLISAGNLSFSVKDAADATCQKTVSVAPPATCSNQVPCSITAAIGNVACDNNSTTGTGTDDTFTFSLTVTGAGTGTGWTTSINGTTFTGSYGIAKPLGPYPISGGALNFTVRDAQNATCSSGATATPPAPCSVTGGPNNYCQSSADFPWHEWISRVVFAGIDKTSAKWYYSDYTANAAAVAPGQSYPISLYSSFSWETNQPHFRVWIDYNRDGQFQEPGEIAFQGIVSAANGAQDALLSGMVSVPANASAGATRMRVSLKRGAYPTACEAHIPFGEVEDFTVVVGSGLEGGSGDRMASQANAIELQAHAASTANHIRTEFFTESAVQNLRLERATAPDFEWKNMEEHNGLWLPEYEPIALDFTDENPAEGANHYRLALGLADGRVIFSDVESIVNQRAAEFAVFPNPLSAGAELSINLEKLMGREVAVQIIHATGRQVFAEKIPVVEQPVLVLPTANFANGEYFIFLQSAGMRPVGKKLVVVRE